MFENHTPTGYFLSLGKVGLQKFFFIFKSLEDPKMKFPFLEFFHTSYVWHWHTMQALETDKLSSSSSYSIPRWSQHLLDAVVTTCGCYTWCCRETSPRGRHVCGFRGVSSISRRRSGTPTWGSTEAVEADHGVEEEEVQDLTLEKMSVNLVF